MRVLFKILVLVVLGWAGRVNCVAESIPARHARIELLAAQSAIVPGQQLWLGVHFSLEKNWHIYWTNPGDSGQPPTLQWQLPSGLTAGEVHWPLPEKLTRSTLADYGYQDDVVLLIPVQAAGGLQYGNKAELGVTAKWLICSDVCIPDHAQLHLSLPVASSASQAEPSLFSNSRGRLPKPWPGSWKAWVLSEKDNFILSIAAGKPIAAAQFFPLVPDEIENAAPQPLQKDREGAKITLKKSEQLLKPIHVLRGLLVLDDGQSYQVEAPVVTPARSKAHND
jgi:thiol:disulfide interchange protein DsbD